MNPAGFEGYILMNALDRKYKEGDRLLRVETGHCTVESISGDEMQVRLGDGTLRTFSITDRFKICTPPPPPTDPFRELRLALTEAWYEGDGLMAQQIVKDNLLPKLEAKERAMEGKYPFDVLAEARQMRNGHYCVYVILLKPYETGGAAVYVGQTFHSPEVRFEQHLEGTHSSKIVEERGWTLLPAIYEPYHSLKRPMAEEAEKALAKALRLIGCTVRGGH